MKRKRDDRSVQPSEEVIDGDGENDETQPLGSSARHFIATLLTRVVLRLWSNQRQQILSAECDGDVKWQVFHSDDLFPLILELVGEENFRSVAGTNRRFREKYKKVDTSSTTEAWQMVQSVAGASLFCQEARPGSRFTVWIWEHDNPNARKKRVVSSFQFVVYTAAYCGRLEVLQWAHLEKGTRLHHEWTSALAHSNWHLNMRQWLREQGSPLDADVELLHRENQCEWDAATCYLAAAGGHLDVLQWLREKGCHWDERTCGLAAYGGHLEVLQWARANQCEWDKTTCDFAARGGHLEVLQWARANNCDWDEETCESAALGGHLQVLQWARTNGCAWNTRTCAHAAEDGHLVVLQWARANGCDWDAATCSWAASNGYLEVLQWARTNGCLWNKWTCALAAQGGYLEVLQWARANGCHWNEETCARAAEGGHLEVLQWARANGCVWDTTTCSSAARHGHLEVLQWARANGCNWDIQTTASAADGGHMGILRWAHANGCDWNADMFVRCARQSPRGARESFGSG